MTEIISIVSGKGGVGKTTLVSNLAISLTDMKQNVLVIDGNVTGANLGLHLGVPIVVPISLNDVFDGNAIITQAIYKNASGFSIIPASLTSLNTDLSQLKFVIFNLLGNYDYILIDAAAGADDEVRAAIQASDKSIIITNPELPAVTNATLVKKFVIDNGKEVIGVVINRKRNEKYELKNEDIEKFLELPIIGNIQEYSKVRESIAFGIPIVKHKPYSEPTNSIKNIARIMLNEEPVNRDLITRFKGFIGHYF
ncbi:MAG: P-loop NTPase [DPANN group archaeon]|nr:P-loop NTPase [DPANN group archaeon]